MMPSELDASKRIHEILVDHKRANPEIVGEAITVSTPEWTWSGAVGGVPGSDAPLTERHLFRIASVTKTFVAASILRLMEGGRVDITKPMLGYVSADTARRLRGGGYDPARITVRQLLNHTGGLYNCASSPRFQERVVNDPQHRWTSAEQIQLAMDDGKPEGQPGEVFAYSDTGYILLGEIIEREMGELLGPAVRKLINYDRFELNNTYWEQMEPGPVGGLFSGAIFNGVDMTRHDHSIDLYGGGGLISTTADLARFFRALIRGEVFEEKRTLAVLLTVPPTRRGEETPLMANGVILYQVGRFACIGHSGFWGQLVVYCPENDVTIAWSKNHNNSEQDGGDIMQDIAAALGMN